MDPMNQPKKPVKIPTKAPPVTVKPAIKRKIGKVMAVINPTNIMNNIGNW